MPKVVNDEMVVFPENMKAIVRRIGYEECARVIGKTSSFVRSLASKGTKRIRKQDLIALENERTSVR